MRAINSAQVTFAASCGGGGYATTLDQLAAAPANGQPFISADLNVNGVQKSGYGHTLVVGANAVQVLAQAATCNNNANSMSTYHAAATPVTAGQTGQRAFATDNSGTIYQNNTGQAIAVGMAGATILQ
jgi:type IV pilus assembly protein PilA